MAAANDLAAPKEARAAAIALHFSAAEPSSLTPVKVPRRIRRRFLECRSISPLSAEKIEAKLKEANLRRKHFHERLLKKAKPKSKSLSCLSQQDIRQQLEAKLNAAQRKRLNLLSNAQIRLARQDDLRQAAKTGLKLRFEKLQEDLGSKVQSRIQQAEANRKRILGTYLQKLSAVQERKARSLSQRIAWEQKYRECVSSAISQKRSASERKRMALLEAERSRAHARVMQAQRAAMALSCQRECDKKKMKEQLESRLQWANRQREEHLRMKINAHSAIPISWMENHDVLSSKLARFWVQFAKSRMTTITLAKTYDTLGINKTAVKSMPFEQLACLIEPAATRQIVKLLLDRLESRFLLYESSSSATPENIDHLLRCVASPGKRIPICKRSREVSEKKSAEVSSPGQLKLSRYPVRAFLCAYMILGHPNAVFSEQGDCEVTLFKAAADFAREFELLIKVIIDGALTSKPLPDATPDDSVDPRESLTQSPLEKTLRNQLAIFDKAWCSYIKFFIAWKVKDVRPTSEGEKPNLSHEMRDIQEQLPEEP